MVLSCRCRQHPQKLWPIAVLGRGRTVSKVTKTSKRKRVETPEQVASHAVLYPGLGDVVAAAGRALSVAGGQDIRTSLSSVTPTSPQRAREDGVVVVGATPSAVLEFSAQTLNPLVESLMGLRASASDATSASASDIRLLRTHLVPALLPVAAALNPDVAAGFALTGATGPKAWSQVRDEHLVEVRIAVNVDDIAGHLTLVLPVAAPERSTPNMAALVAAAGVRVPLRVTLPPVPVSAARIQSLAVGDLLPLTSAATPWLLTAPGMLIGTGSLGQLESRVALQLTTLRKETPMEMPTADLPAVTGEQTEATTVLDALGVVGDVIIDVTVESGRVSMPLHELAALREGAVLRLDRGPSAPVDVLANGKKVATAQSVTMDGQLALRILTISDR